MILHPHMRSVESVVAHAFKWTAESVWRVTRVANVWTRTMNHTASLLVDRAVAWIEEVAER